ncbi:TRAP transporter substrate-binding protein [Paralcaligenes sp. KSB-10]|jgi:tripartite ATP-independent transporter DctP family solute receptor|uniref:TRAP transporter substrate-binding protein n=1 Tax=Paralcaligenes sp. KSB-10 TaxID=2901142 RepID=UPI001E5660B4|nr:TRAP transporter substrate-binding protein [Paralcaligenes sp. KSB-10]UHL63426.1 TRAP transporter substrate-binding protein [Paralcaligenes sp. KSB-10]
MKLSRRSFMLTTAGAGAAIIAAPLQSVMAATTYRYKYANNLPVTHPMNVRAKEMAKKIEEETKGRFKLQIFPSSQLGSDTETLNQLRAGAVEFFTLSGLILSTLVPAAAISGIGFAFPSYDSVWKAMDGDLGSYIRGEIGKSGLVVMDKIWDNGFRQVTTSNKPIVTPDDFKDLKIRVPVSPLWTSMFKALKSAPTSINFNEVYSALQTKVVDAQENPLAIIQTAKLFEVQKYCSLTNHMWDGFWFLGNHDAWNRLPKDIQAIVAKHVNEAGVKERADVAALNDDLQKKLTSEHMVFNTPKTGPIRDTLRQAGFYAEWKKKFGDSAWATLEKSVGSLT